MDETRTTQPTPEQLVKLLDAQLNLTRSKRTADPAPRRVALLVGGLLLIVGGCCAALLVLQQMLSDLQRQPRSNPAQTEAAAGEIKNF